MDGVGFVGMREAQRARRRALRRRKLVVMSMLIWTLAPKAITDGRSSRLRPDQGLTTMSTTDDGFEISSCSDCGKVVCRIPSSDPRYRDSLMARWDIWKTGNPQPFNVDHEVVEGCAGERHVCAAPGA